MHTAKEEAMKAQLTPSSMANTAAVDMMQLQQPQIPTPEQIAEYEREHRDQASMRCILNAIESSNDAELNSRMLKLLTPIVLRASTVAPHILMETARYSLQRDLRQEAIEALRPLAIEAILKAGK